MDHRTILLMLNKETSGEILAEYAENARTNDAHLICLMLGSTPALPYYAYGNPPYGTVSAPENWTELVHKTRSEQCARAEHIETLLARIQAFGEVRSLICSSYDIKYDVAQCAMACDVAHIAPNLRETEVMFREATHGLLFRSPVGLVLNGDPSVTRRRIFVAWNGGLACARAVHAALPYLGACEEVIIGCFDPVMSSEKDGENPGSDIAAWLSHRGCAVSVHQYPSGGLEIGRCIQDRAAETGADLVVMGAYGHARAREAIFGGTTRTMIEQAELPVLIAH
ncbi:universal stress protein [Ruegeria jejuensis]|uniref:universal stress protein n=1 Tax=Ruegeria jejuensis TaxID=3233338 RepID=UPI00355BAC40